MKIVNLATDLCDGVMLCMLLEAVSGKCIEQYFLKPKHRAHRLDNAQVALRFLKSEGIKVIGVGPEDVVDRNV